jgi:hypothetical protein
VPELIPVVMPVEDPTVATDELLLLHKPPVDEELKGVADPVHTFSPPVIEAGKERTVRVLVAVQPALVL